jgi:hypothetical protein
VYALYVHWRFIKLFLVSLWVSENALMLGTLIYALSDVKFNAANCVITRLPPEFGWFACVPSTLLLRAGLIQPQSMGDTRRGRAPRDDAPQVHAVPS